MSQQLARTFRPHPKPAGRLNPYQQAARQAYAGGIYSHIVSVAQAEACGDTLLILIMRDLSDREGCTSPQIARTRLETAIRELGEVLGTMPGDIAA